VRKIDFHKYYLERKQNETYKTLLTSHLPNPVFILRKPKDSNKTEISFQNEAAKAMNPNGDIFSQLSFPSLDDKARNGRKNSSVLLISERDSYTDIRMDDFENLKSPDKEDSIDLSLEPFICSHFQKIKGEVKYDLVKTNGKNQKQFFTITFTPIT